MSEWTVDTLHEHMCRLFELTKTHHAEGPMRR